ncbi:GGDEF domain-containing protein [Vibrio algarum]|uniref:GGDEF domain-containing protein n=1 Tax=Vibrio algarum TaxID=3020714 RepID=A0ABT4YWM4_9VIBR|nr:GGDEF domain-containing protein [Vibrio sp. KJ40-1]MDB1125556.1 GGDEF domain-containing protein [Vibrio sp. KJ40-1]
MRDQLRGIKLEAMADIRQSRKKKLLITFSSIALVILYCYSVVNYLDGKQLIALVNLVSATCCAGHICYILINKTASYSPLIPSIAVLINAFINIAEPTGTIFWVYPIISAILMINEFRTSLIYTVVFFIGAFTILMMGADSSIDYFTYQNLSVDKFLLSTLTLCIVTLISNYGYKNASDYLQSLYQEGIDQLAYRDRLTGLANRWSFEVWSKDKLIIADKQSSITALLFLDIDNFKTINDTYGHDRGDKLLQLFSKRIQSNMRTTDRSTNKDDYSIARYAGDEFMVLLHDIPTIEDLQRIVSRINTLFDDELSQTELELAAHLTFSIGIAIYKEDANSLEDLIRCADKAMYEAKNLGKNRYQFYHSAQNESTKPTKLSIA